MLHQQTSSIGKVPHSCLPSIDKKLYGAVRAPEVVWKAFLETTSAGSSKQQKGIKTLRTVRKAGVQALQRQNHTATESENGLVRVDISSEMNHRAQSYDMLSVLRCVCSGLDQHQVCTKTIHAVFAEHKFLFSFRAMENISALIRSDGANTMLASRIYEVLTSTDLALDCCSISSLQSVLILWLIPSLRELGWNPFLMI